MTTPTITSAFMDFDAFHVRWVSAVASTGIAFEITLIDEAIGLGERLVVETDATGQGREFSLISALTHIETVIENRDEDSDDDEGIIAAADALVTEMNALVNA